MRLHKMIFLSYCFVYYLSCFPHFSEFLTKRSLTAMREADYVIDLGVPRQVATFVACLSDESTTKAEPRSEVLRLQQR